MWECKMSLRFQVECFRPARIGAVDAWTLFVSLDMDGDHTVSVEDYVVSTGC